MKRMLLLFAALLLLGGCQTAPDAGQAEPEQANQEVTEMAEYRKLTAKQAYERMAAEDVTVVDVRTQEEYDAGHIGSAILLPNETIGEEPPDALPDKDAVLLVYCRSGRRSREASEKLLALGYRNVLDFGGINDWPYDIVTEKKSE